MATPKNYNRGMDYLNEHFPFFATMVVNLGRPVVCNTVIGRVTDDKHEFLKEGDPIYKVPTLQVQRNKDDDEFELLINEEFLEAPLHHGKPMTDAEIAGCLAHEAFHIAFSHLDELFQNEKEDGKDKRKRTLAQECICNDNVINEGFDLPDLRRRSKKTSELKGGLFFGPDVVQRPVAYYSTEEVMALIKDDNENMEGAEEENDHFVIMSAEDMKDLQDQIEKAVRHGVLQGKIDPEDVNSDDLKNIMKVNQSIKKAGASSNKTKRRFDKMGLSVNWFKYLRRLDPSAFRDGGNAGDLATSWHAPRRKLAHAYPRINLPVYKSRFSPNNIGSLKPQIVLALDFSGSIPPEMTDVMGNLARAVPSSIDVHCCTFSTEFVPFNHKTNEDQETASGGTDFSAIEQYVRSLGLKKQPNVVVITDGEAGFNTAKPSQEILDHRWNWLLINPNDEVRATGVKKETVEFLQDYILQK